MVSKSEHNVLTCFTDSHNKVVAERPLGSGIYMAATSHLMLAYFGVYSFLTNLYFPGIFSGTAVGAPCRFAVTNCCCTINQPSINAIINYTVYLHVK